MHLAPDTDEGKDEIQNSNFILTETINHIAVIKLNRGIPNPVDQELVGPLMAKLADLGEDEDVRAVVLTSNNEKFFSMGLNIPELLKLTRGEFTAFIRSFGQLCLSMYSYPKPLIAAQTGHAIAAGCILAMCCDYRIVADGRKLMGVNEVKLGVPVPYPSESIIRQVVGERTAREIMETGEFYGPQDLLAKGMVDEVVEQDRVIARAMELASSLGSMPRNAYTIIKGNRTRSILAEADGLIDEHEELFIDCWYSEKTQELLKEAAKKF